MLYNRTSTICITTSRLYDYTRWRVDDWSFFEYLSPFCFLSIEFHCTFPFLIKYYYILFIIIVFWLGCDRPSGHLLFRVRFAFFHTHASLLTTFVCFIILFHSFCWSMRWSYLSKILKSEYELWVSQRWLSCLSLREIFSVDLRIRITIKQLLACNKQIL